jgi:hypothetical protein
VALADRITLVTQAVKDKIIDQIALLDDIQPSDVYWPDQLKIPRTPAICIDSGDYVREMAGSLGPKGRTENRFVIFLMCYLCKVADVQLTQQSVEDFAEQVMDILHQDVTMGGTVIHGFVTRIEPGYANRNSVMFRTARITWEGFR